MSSGLRIVFFGTPEFASTILRHLIGAGEDVVGVVTTPPKPQGRGLVLRGSAVHAVADECGIPVLTPTKHRDPDFLEALRAMGADIFVVVAYKILPMEVIAMPRLGAFNVHASLLPRYRGAAPINWAIIRGERETGVTTFLLDQHIDTGNTLLTARREIGPNETAGELHDALMMLGADLAHKTLLGLASGTLQPTPQDDAAASPAPKIFPKDCVIDLTRPAEDVHNFIRGLSPHPGATTELPNGERAKVLRALIPEAPAVPALAPGQFHVSEDHKHLYIGTGSGALEITELQREGKRPMSAEEFLRGARFMKE